MKRWLSSIIDVRKGEGLVTILMALYIYLILVVYYLLKPARDSLFLSNSGPELLPLVFVLIAIVVVPITTMYSLISRKLKLNQIINFTTLFIISNLLILRWLLTFKGQEWVFFAFYIWVSIYGALITSQFWLLANAVYDASQAKRIFVIFSLAAIIGAFTGGAITSFFIKTFGVSTENLLYFCMLFLGFCIPLVNIVWAKRDKEGIKEAPTPSRRKEKSQESWGQMFKDIKGSRHLRLIMGIIAMTMAVASFVDYQFKFVSTDAYSTYAITDDFIAAQKDILPASILAKLENLKDQTFNDREKFNAMLKATIGSNDAKKYKSKIVKKATSTNKEAFTAFLGEFYGGLSLLGFLLQFLFSYRALKIFGVGGVILFLPSSLILASLGMMISPKLVNAVLLRGSDGVFKYSIDKTARELLFLPIPLEVKKRSKIFIDLFIDRIFRGISGLVLLYFTLQLDLTMRQLSIAVILMLAIWIFLDLLIRKEYVNAFRKALSKGDIDPEKLTFKINDASTVTHLMNALQSDNDRQVSYALGMLSDVQSEKLTEALQPFLSHNNGEVRSKTVKVLQNQENVPYDKEIEKLLNDEDPEVRIETMYYLYKNCGKTERNQWLKTSLYSSEFKIQSAALGCTALYADEEDRGLINGQIIENFLKKVGRESQTSKILVAQALGNLANPLFRQYLLKLINDSSVPVVKAAIKGIGATQDREMLPQLLSMLSDKHFRGEAREALACYGNKIVGALSDYLTDASVDLSIRKNIPRVLLKIPTQKSIDALTNIMSKVEPGIKHAIIRVLNRLRNKHVELNFNERAVHNALQEEAKSYYKVYQILNLYQGDKEQNGGVKQSLLNKALIEKLDKNKERIFRLLSLTYPAKDLYNAYQGIMSDNKTIRASGVEFLDNLLHKDIKVFLMPIFEEASQDDINRTARKTFKIQIPAKDDALEQLIQGNDPWLQACAIATINNDSGAHLKKMVEEIRRTDNQLVKETAEFVVKSLE